MSTEVRVAKIKKRKLCLEWSQEAGRGRSHLQHSSSIVDPTPRASILQRTSTPLSLQGDRRFPPPPATAQPMRDSHSSANEKPLYCERPVYSNELLVYSSLPEFPPPSIKEPLLLYSPRVACGFALLLRDCSSPLLPNKSIFAGKITSRFIFKVNRVHTGSVRSLGE